MAIEDSPRVTGVEPQFPRLALTILLLLAGIIFVCGGPLRIFWGFHQQNPSHLKDPIDFQTFFSSTQAWLQGSDPYDSRNLRSLLIASGCKGNTFPIAVSPPVLFPILSPLGLLDWPHARVVWTCLQPVLMVAMLLILVTGVAGWSPADRASMEYAALALVMWPSYTGVLFGQTAILAAFLIVLGIFFEIRHGDWQAGISFTLAAAIKPQMAVFFLLVALCRLRWRTWLAATVLGMLLLVVSLSQLYVHHIDWMSSIVESNWVVSRPGGINDPSTLNSENFAILSLTLPLRLLIADNTAVNCLAFFLSAVTGGVAFWLLRKSRDRRSELLRYSIIAVLSLLGVYNRCYDAILLLLPLLWAFMSWRTADRLWAIIAVILTLPFCFVWWMSVLVHMTRAGMISQGAFHSWWWRTFITPHHVYALLLLAVCLCCAAWQNRCPQCQPERQQPSPAAAD